MAAGQEHAVEVGEQMRRHKVVANERAEERRAKCGSAELGAKLENTVQDPAERKVEHFAGKIAIFSGKIHGPSES